MSLLGKWDTASAVSLDLANQILARNASQALSTFDFEGHSVPPGGGVGLHYRCSGAFGVWRIITGAGTLLKLALPIVQGSIVVEGGASVQLDGTTANMSLALQLLPAPGGNQRLAFDMRGAGSLGDVQSPGLVVPVALEGPASVLNQLGDGGRTVLDGLAKVLAQRASKQSFAFASVNLVAPGTRSWLAPAACTYAFFPAAGRSYLCILSVTEPADLSHADRTVAPELMAGGPDAGFAICQDLFLRNVILPLLPGAFGGDASLDHLRYDSTSHAIAVQSGFKIKGFREGAITYYPRVNKLAVSTTGDGVKVDVSGDCDLKMGLSMTYSVSSQHTMVFDAGKQKISFQPDLNPHSHHDISMSLWERLTIGLVLGPIVDAVANFIAGLVANGIASDLTDSLGTQALGGLQPQSVHWTGLQTLNVQRAALDIDFVLGCTLAA